MTSPYFFFRPLLAVDQSWAAINWQSGSPETSEHADFVRCFFESGANRLANTLQLIVSANPDWFNQGTAVDAFETAQVIFVLPAKCLEDSQIIERCKHHHVRAR